MSDDRRDSRRWQRVKQLVADAVERPPAERASFLAAACAGDEALQREVKALIAAHDQAGDFFERKTPSIADLAETALPLTIGQFARGQRLAHYEIVEAIGAGGMGEVYRARDTRLHRDVALKILPAAVVADPSRRERFVQEARAASAVEHPHIAAIHDIGEADGVIYIAMELVRGEPLGRVIARGNLAPPRALDLSIEIAEALARAHEIGLVHRDLKPANVMLTEDDHAKIIDFGLAKLVRQLGGDADVTRISDRTATGVVLGTPSYLSPEQAQAASVDHRSDIFSFGILLHEMLTGRSPFRGNTPIDTVHAILHSPPPPLPSSIGEATADLQRIIARCLAKNADHRYQQTRDLLVDLRTARRRLEHVELAPEVIAAAMQRRRIEIAVATLVVALIVASLAAWAVRRAQDERDRAAAIADAEALLDRAQFADVWRTTGIALQRWPGDPTLDRLRRSASHTITIVTEPSGAALYFKAYDDVDGEWLPLGTSPLIDVRAPLGMLRWKIAKPGFEPLEARLAVGLLAASGPDFATRPIRLRPVGSDPAVFVPGGPEEGVQLTDYWIDQTEVTNRDFKRFVDDGGYEQHAHWIELPGREVAAAWFRDKTGRPGPSTWELATYPQGKADYPVTGVSWFEAAAYCRSVGKTLPTIFHWRKAFGGAAFMEVVTLGNFGGEGPHAVDQLKDVSEYGTVGMAGNVKEWVWNQFKSDRYMLGGAWNEPVYMALTDDVRPPLERTETSGFRCMKESGASDAAAYAGLTAAVTRDFNREKPVDDATFEVLRRFYAYDPTPLDARTERSTDEEHWRRERGSFAAAYGGERVPVNILLPKNSAPPYQAVIWFPGSYALGLTRSDGELEFTYYFDFVPRSGRALVYPVYKGTYERSLTRDLRDFDARPNLWRDLVVQWSKDLSRTVDYLSSRSDFDANKLAFYGFSLGASDMVAAIALEPRLKAAILLTGGMNPSAERPEVEPLNFLPRIKIPVLLLGGRYDFVFPPEPSQHMFFQFLGTPPEHKRHVIFEDAGHVPPRVDVIRESLEWLDRYLGPVERRRP
jgi:eukaryotic-like serine/threonine-protein kinase